VQSFTARMPLLTATNAFRLLRRRWSSPLDTVFVPPVVPISLSSKFGTVMQTGPLECQNFEYSFPLLECSGNIFLGQNILRQSYDNAKVTIDLRLTSNLQNILRRTQGFS